MPPRSSTRSTRVGYVAKVFPRLSETFVINEVSELERQGMDVHVFTLHAPPVAVPHRVLSELVASVTCVDALEPPTERECRRAKRRLVGRSNVSVSLQERLFPRKYIRLALQLEKAVRERSLTRLHAHFASRATHVAMLASDLCKIPYSFTAHAKDIYHRDVDRDLLRLKIRGAEFVVTVSDFNRRVLLEIGDGLENAAAKVNRLYNGVDLERFRPGSPRERSSGRVVAVGRLVEKKGFCHLVEASRLLDQRGVSMDAHVIGAGPEESRLRELIGAFGLGGVVHLRGALPAEEVAAAIREASVLVLPCIVGSDGNVDALPTVLLEAMASGVPVISTHLSGIPEIIVDDVTGYLVKPGDPRGLADAIQRVLSDSGRAERLGKAGRQRAQEMFDLRKNVAWLHERFTSDASWGDRRGEA